MPPPPERTFRVHRRTVDVTVDIKGTGLRPAATELDDHRFPRSRDNVLLFRREFLPSLEDFFLEREDVDRIPAANVFAQAAARAVLLIDGADAEEVVDAVRVLQTQGVERANVDAQFAARADVSGATHPS